MVASLHPALEPCGIIFCIVSYYWASFAPLGEQLEAQAAVCFCWVRLGARLAVRGLGRLGFEPCRTRKLRRFSSTPDFFLCGRYFCT
jgi:hypothetical protein